MSQRVPRLRPMIAATLCLAAVSAATPSAASASRSQITFFEAPALLLDPATRPATFATLQRLGVRALRVELSWRAVAPAPSSRRKPSFAASEPSSYSWGNYDTLLEQAHALGWTVLLTVTSPVPRWAQSNTASRTYDYRPNARMFREFMTAVGRHYGALASIFGIWNEPNHHEFLEPQFNRNGSPASPAIYKSLYEAGYAGLRAGGIGGARVLFGETAPEGQERARGGRNVGPLTFLRGALCLSSGYRRSGGCPRLQMNGYAIHPYPSVLGPLVAPFNRESVTIAALSRITHALDAAARAGAVPRGLPVYITEFGIMSRPNRYQGVSPAVQAEYDAISEHIAYANPRVASFSQYLLQDDPIRRTSVGFQTGLRYATGRNKPLFSAFPLPLSVKRSGHGFALWGLVRPAGGATTVTVEARRPHSSSFTVLAHPATDAQGYWTLSSAVPAGRWRVSWVSPQGVRYRGPPIGAR